MGEKIWAFRPTKNIIQEHLMTLKKYPPRGSDMQNQTAIDEQSSAQ